MKTIGAVIIDVHSSIVQEYLEGDSIDDVRKQFRELGYEGLRDYELYVHETSIEKFKRKGW